VYAIYLASVLLELNKYISWENIGEFYGISGTTLRAYANGRKLINKKHRKVFGMPDQVIMPVCPTCGIVHVKKCPAKKKAKHELSEEEKKRKFLKRMLCDAKKALHENWIDYYTFETILENVK
jgi:hypothetical protein